MVPVELSAALLSACFMPAQILCRHVRYHWPGFASGVSCAVAEHLPKCVTLTPQAVPSVVRSLLLLLVRKYNTVLPSIAAHLPPVSLLR